MTDAPKMIALRWQPGAAVTSGPLMDHPDYTRYVRQDMTRPIEQAADAVERELAGLRAKPAEDHGANLKARFAAQKAEAFHVAAEADDLRPVAAPDMAQISDMWLPINDRPAVWPWVVAAAVVVALIATVGMAAHAAAVAQAATMGAW